MPPNLRYHALLSQIAADLTLARADRALKACVTEVSVPTAYRVLHGHDHKISTLVDVADALDCEVIIVIRKRPAA